MSHRNIKEEAAWDCNISEGDVQCPFVLVRELEQGYSYCRYREGHPMPHQTNSGGVAIKDGYEIYGPEKGIRRYWSLKPAYDELRKEYADLKALVNHPKLDDFFEGIRIEQAFQIEKWGVMHDEQKTVWDWFWVIGYVAQKCAAAMMILDLDKAKHHAITTAAVLFQWYQRMTPVNVIPEGYGIVPKGERIKANDEYWDGKRFTNVRRHEDFIYVTDKYLVIRAGL